MEKIRILLVDDHQMFREALRGLLERQDNLEVVGEASDATKIVDVVRQTSPDVVCLDITMPQVNGIEATRLLNEAVPGIKIIGLSTHSEQRYVMDLMNAGASGYVTKAEASEELLRAISAVINNRKYLCPDVAESVMGGANQQFNSGKVPSLGKREAQVLELVAEGLTSSAIAEKLYIAASTVEVHRRNIMRKLNLHSVAELTRYAIANKVN
ncbi:MAG: response regulator transcription factor [Gallionellaceae bacterium]|jgi:two-component system NarL family response regulator